MGRTDKSIDALGRGSIAGGPEGIETSTELDQEERISATEGS
jgi:hypothetical protein